MCAIHHTPARAPGIGFNQAREEEFMNEQVTYWGILCRSCLQPVAFETSSNQGFVFGSANTRPGAIRCAEGHNHIYFPRDFRFTPSAVAITEATMRANREAYKATNPSPSHSSGYLHAEPSHVQQKRVSSLSAGAPLIDKGRLASLVSDARKEAQQVAKERWANWALKKAL
jgi:hypothetical protein